MNREDVMTSRRAAGGVVRYHAWPTLQRQTVAEHSWRVATILRELFPQLCSSSALCYALEHDMDELHTGDLPFHVKNKHPKIKNAMEDAALEGKVALGVIPLVELDEWERDAVKICDLLEMFEFGLVERAMGSKFAEPVIQGARWGALDRARTYDWEERVKTWCDEEERRYA